MQEDRAPAPQLEQARLGERSTLAVHKGDPFAVDAERIVLLQMVAADVRAPDTHRVLTQIGDAITRRLIELAWAELEDERDAIKDLI